MENQKNSAKTAKSVLKKAADSSYDPIMSPLSLEAHHHKDIYTSPAQRLLYRRTRSLLPFAGKILQKNVVHQVAHKMECKNHKQAVYYDTGAKDPTFARSV